MRKYFKLTLPFLRYVNFKFIWENLCHSLTHLIYPTKCVHCQALLPPQSLVLCEGCAPLLELISPHERCQACYAVLSHQESAVCRACVQFPSHYHLMAAAFDYEGPPASLVKKLKYGNQPYLAQGMAAFLVAQIDQLKWQMPDFLIPVPMPLIKKLERGYNQSELLAEEMGKLLGVPVLKALKRRSGDFSQAALKLEQRKMLEGSSFERDSKYALEGKVLLVVDDVMTSGLTFQRCAEALLEGNPALLYAIAFCRA